MYLILLFLKIWSNLKVVIFFSLNGLNKISLDAIFEKFLEKFNYYLIKRIGLNGFFELKT